VIRIFDGHRIDSSGDEHGTTNGDNEMTSVQAWLRGVFGLRTV